MNSSAGVQRCGFDERHADCFWRAIWLYRNELHDAACPSRAYVERLLEKAHSIALAALRANTVLGGLAKYEIRKSEQECRVIYICDLAVSSAYRREDVSIALAAELKRIGSTREAYVIFVQADVGNTPAIELYHTLGT